MSIDPVQDRVAALSREIQVLHALVEGLVATTKKQADVARKAAETQAVMTTAITQLQAHIAALQARDPRA